MYEVEEHEAAEKWRRIAVVVAVAVVVVFIELCTECIFMMRAE